MFDQQLEVWAAAEDAAPRDAEGQPKITDLILVYSSCTAPGPGSSSSPISRVQNVHTLAGWLARFDPKPRAHARGVVTAPTSPAGPGRPAA